MIIFLYSFYLLLFLVLGGISLFLSHSLRRERKKVKREEKRTRAAERKVSRLLSKNREQYQRMVDLAKEIRSLGASYRELCQKNFKSQHEIEELSVLREIGIATSSSIELREVLKTIIGVVSDAMQTKETTIYLTGEEGEHLFPKIKNIDSRVILEEESEPSGGEKDLLGMLKNRGSHVMLKDSYCFAPLIAEEEKVLGVIKFRRDGSRSFGSEEKWFLENVTRHVSLALRNALLYDKAVTDGLTRLYNHNHFQDSLQNQFLISKRYGRKLSLVMLDIDHFKKVNDDHGHQTGDLVLVKIAQMLKKKCRDADRAYRYGGEELAIIMPDTDCREALVGGERLREDIQTYPFTTFKGEPLSLTASLGISTLTEKIGKKEDMVWQADQALYQAKREGRNKTVMYQGEEKKYEEYSSVPVL